LASVLGAAAYIAYEWHSLRGALVIFSLAGVGIPLIWLQIWLTLRALRAEGPSPVVEIGTSSSLSAREAMHRTIEVTVWLLGLAAGVYLIGFHVTAVVFVILYVRTYGGGWIAAAILAGLAEAFVIVVFDLLLSVFWPTPYLLRLLGI
jgi:hypothetical protein